MYYVKGQLLLVSFVCCTVLTVPTEHIKCLPVFPRGSVLEADSSSVYQEVIHLLYDYIQGQLIESTSLHPIFLMHPALVKAYTWP